MQGRQRDLALFNLAIDSKLRSCDVVAIRVDHVAASGYAMDRAPIRRRKTCRPLLLELTAQTRMAIDEYLRLRGRNADMVGDAFASPTTRLPTPGSAV
jgi:integrase